MASFNHIVLDLINFILGVSDQSYAFPMVKLKEKKMSRITEFLSEK